MAENTVSTEELFAMIYGLWTKWANGLQNRSKEEVEKEKQIVKRFMALEGIENEKSPACLMFSAFIGGLNEGVDFITSAYKLDEEDTTAKEEGPASGQDRQSQQG